MNTQHKGRDTQGLWLYRWISQFKLLTYRTKIMVMAFVGTHIPLITLATWSALQASSDLRTLLTTLGVALVATLVGTGLTLYMLNQLLLPVLMTSKALRVYRETRERIVLPTHFSDEVGTLMADANLTIDHLEATLDTLEHVDEATHLPNRKRFAEQIEARIARGRPFAIAVMRFNDFLRVAETLDRKRADSAALTLAQRLAARPEFSNQLARVALPDFACIVDASQSADQPWVDVADRLRLALDACAAELVLRDFTLKPGLHAGLASFPEDGTDAQALIDSAIAAASLANDAAPVILHSAKAREASLDRFRIEQDLRRALERNEFDLHFQPVVDVRAGRAVGAEALIRWHHPTRGMVPPLAFIGAAEASGLIEPIGLWVLRAACAQLSTWNAEMPAPLTMAINVSARQFLDPAFKQHILEAIRDYRLSPDQLEIELTETSAMVDHDYTRRMFTELRDAGVGIAIDDFGTGYASMSYLRKLPFDKLKIDREFVTDVHRVRHGQAICSALIELAKGLDLKILAEGAEKEEEVRFLSERGCDLFQGFYFSRPVPAAAFAQAIELPPAFKQG
jgi:EAL domain-containing protein (putative c-di-GMP-specific phosphodiesterase class I)/GGDEF domain-containing protein